MKNLNDKSPFVRLVNYLRDEKQDFKTGDVCIVPTTMKGRQIHRYSLVQHKTYDPHKVEPAPKQPASRGQKVDKAA